MILYKPSYGIRCLLGSCGFNGALDIHGWNQKATAFIVTTYFSCQMHGGINNLGLRFKYKYYIVYSQNIMIYFQYVTCEMLVHLRIFFFGCLEHLICMSIVSTL